MSRSRSRLNESAILGKDLSRLENKQNMESGEIREMIDLLKAYETLCIQREDFTGAQSVKRKIEQLKGQQLLHRRETIAVKEKTNMQVICKAGELEIKQFQERWDGIIEQLVQEMKQTEEKFIEQHQKQLQDFIQKIEVEQPPKMKYSPMVLQKRKYLSSLIKTRNYKAAEQVKNTLKDMEQVQQVKWVQKHEERKQKRIEKLNKKHLSQLDVFRVKLEGMFNEKIKERDRKFEILLKKNRKRRIESSKPSRDRIRSKNGLLAESGLSLSVSRNQGWPSRTQPLRPQ